MEIILKLFNQNQYRLVTPIATTLGNEYVYHNKSMSSKARVDDPNIR